MSTATRSAPSVAGRLTRTVATFLLLLVAVSATGAVCLAVVQRTRAAEVRLDALADANTAMLLAMANAETGVRGYRLAQDRVFLEPYEAGRADFAVRARQALTASARDDERALVREQVALSEDWFATYGDVVAAMPPGQVAVSAARTRANRRAFEAYRAANGELGALAAERQRAARDLERAVRAWSLVVVAAALLLALAATLAVHRRTRRALEEPLHRVVAVLGRLTAGDHTARADASDGPEEVRGLARSVNALADESDRLRQERAAAARGQRLALEIGHGVRDRVVSGDPVAEATERLGHELDADRVYLRALDGGVLHEVGHEWHQEHLAPLGPAAAGALDDDVLVTRLRDLYARGEVYAVEDLRAVAGQDPRVDETARRTGARAALVAPLGVGDRPLGALCLLVHSGPRRWSEHETALVASVAADLGRALAVAGLLRQQDELLAQLRDLDATKTTFLSTVSHELRTPLTSIAGYVEMLLDGAAGPLPERAGELLGVVERNTDRLKGLIEDLLTLSRIETGTFRVSRADVALADVVAAAEHAVRPSAEAAGLVLEVADCPRGLLVRADPVQVQRALLELLANAVKFTPAGGRVAVSVREVADGAEVEVADTGIGIPAAEQGRVFTRFFRASNATERAVPGTGLGLMIVRSIVEHHGGRLQVRSAEGEGTTATVRLPLAASPAPAPTAPAEAVAR